MLKLSIVWLVYKLRLAQLLAYLFALLKKRRIINKTSKLIAKHPNL